MDVIINPISPENVKTVKIKVSQCVGRPHQAHISFPMDLVRRYNLQNNDEIVIVYIKKVDNPEKEKIE